MNFLILSAAAALVLVSVPIYLARRLRREWKMPRGMFLKAGVLLLVIEVIHMAVVGNGTSLWPQIFDLPVALRALILGTVAGLFFELGRYLILDKVMKSARSYKEGVYFGMGWNGVETVLLGVLMFIGVFGIQMLMDTQDIAAKFPQAGTGDIQQLQEYRQQALDLIKGNPLLALTPVLERASLMIVDIALTLLILVALVRGETLFAWAAVAFRALFIASLIYVSSLDPVAGEAVFIVYGALAVLMIRRTKPLMQAL